MAKRKRLIPSLGPGFEVAEPPQGGSDPLARAAETLSGPPLTGASLTGTPGALTPEAGALRPGPGLRMAASAPPIARVAAEASAQAALQEMAEGIQRARQEGRMLLSLPLQSVDAGYLVRDRLGLDEEELAPLLASLRSHGQRMPIEVTDLGQGRYGLISGWRRLQALSRLALEDPARFGQIQALLRRPSEASEAYVAMVEENEIRQGLSYYERARIAARAVDLGVFESEKQALQQLFAAASRARRSKIGSFLGLYRALDEMLSHPAAIPERLGLALAKAVESRAQELPALAEALRAGAEDGGAMAEEIALLTRFAAGQSLQPGRVGKPAGASQEAAPELVPGLIWQRQEGRTGAKVTLAGPRVTPELLARLESWLRENA